MKSLFCSLVFVAVLVAQQPVSHTPREKKLNADFHRLFDKQRDGIVRELEQYGVDVRPLRRECYGFMTEQKGLRCAAEMQKAAESLPDDPAPKL